MAFHEIKIGTKNFTLAPKYIQGPETAGSTGDFGFLLFRYLEDKPGICKLYSPGVYDLPIIKYSSGNFCLDCNILPDTSNTWNVGSSNLKFNTMYATTFHGDLSGNATSATNATNVNVVTSSANTNYPLVFTTSVTAGNKVLSTDTANSLYYNPSTNILTAGSIKVTGTASSTATIKADAATNMYVDIGGNVPLVIKYDSTDKFIACGSSFSNLINLGTSARKWAAVHATTFYGALTGNATTATTATNATNVNVTTSSTSSNYPLVFTSSVTAGNKRLYTDTVNSLYYNPSTNLLKIDSGKVEATNGFYETSDERLKDFQEDIEVNFSYLHNIPKKYYSWKYDSTYTRHIGTSAQEVQKYYPELVNTDETGYLTMNYDKLSVVALKAIDILHEEVTELKKENAELKERLAKLEELILNK